MVPLGASRCANLGWKMYDEQFRLRKAQDPTSSWSSVDYELWLIHMNITSSPGTGNQMIFSNKKNGAQKCYNFNYQGTCFRQHCFIAIPVSIVMVGIRCFSVIVSKGRKNFKMKKFEDTPQFIILHVAGNDLGCKKVVFLRNEIKNIIRWILIELPNTTIIWSQILPRLKWRYSQTKLICMNVVTELIIILHPLLQSLVVIKSSTQIYAETIYF